MPCDNSSGTEIAWHDEPLFVLGREEEQFEIKSWYGYSSGTGEYRAVLTKWSINTKEKAIHLEHISLREIYSGWRDDFTNPAVLVPDAHKRKARVVGRERFDMGKFKRLRLYPQE